MIIARSILKFAPAFSLGALLTLYPWLGWSVPVIAGLILMVAACCVAADAILGQCKQEQLKREIQAQLMAEASRVMRAKSAEIDEFAAETIRQHLERKPGGLH